MRKILFVSLTLLAALPTIVQAQEPIRFTHEGVSYEYLVRPRADGSRVISGRNLSSRQAFRLVVRGRNVTGTFGSDAVAFRAPATASASTRIASND